MKKHFVRFIAVLVVLLSTTLVMAGIHSVSIPYSGNGTTVNVSGITLYQSAPNAYRVETYSDQGKPIYRQKVEVRLWQIIACGHNSVLAYVKQVCDTGTNGGNYCQSSVESNAGAIYVSRSAGERIVTKHVGVNKYNSHQPPYQQLTARAKFFTAHDLNGNANTSDWESGGSCSVRTATDTPD
jgi:hypothetical protein